MAETRLIIDDTVLRRMQGNQAGLDRWLRGVGTEMVGDVKASFGTSPSGRRYQRGRREHVASLPGYPPNIDTGSLRASIKIRQTGTLKYRIEDGVEYGYKLETGVGIAPRPFIKPVFDRWGREIRGKAGRELERILTR